MKGDVCGNHVDIFERVLAGKKILSVIASVSTYMHCTTTIGLVPITCRCVFHLSLMFTITDFFAENLFDCNLCLQENTNDKKPCEVKMPHTPKKLAEARSVFENGASEKDITNKKEKLFPPPKPPRMAGMEANSEETQVGEQQQPAKRKAPSPPKETKESSNTKVENQSSTSLIKRKAPEPPTSNQEESKICSEERSNTVRISEAKGDQKDTKERNYPSQSSSTDEEGDGSCTPVPAKRERKGSVESLDGIDKTKGDQPTPKPRKKVQNSCEANEDAQEEHDSKASKQKEKAEGSVKKAKTTGLDNTVTIVATPVDGRRSTTDKSKRRPQEQPCIIQACLVEDKLPVAPAKKENNENTVTVKAISCNGPEVKTKGSRGEKVINGNKTERHCKKDNLAEKVSSDVIPAVSLGSKPPTSSKKTREPTKKDDLAFKVPRRPTRECQFDPNETVNLNDVNIHEMTFTFDFGQFDQELEKDRDSMFKLSYEENCKQVGRFFFKHVG